MSDIPQFIGDGPTGAVLDETRTYRYSLWRRWRDCSPSEMCVFIGLNPSKADERSDDLTITKCIGFAERWGFGGLVMLNLFAFRTTYPTELRAERYPVGPLNDDALERAAGVAARTVCCWGAYKMRGDYQWRGHRVRTMLKWCWHLGLTKAGYPKHPSRLAYATTPERW